MSQQFAFVFPGQGSQHIGMMSEFKDESLVQQTFEAASDTLGENMWQLCQEGPESKLNDTRWTQPALLTASIALWRLWQSRTENMPQRLAGHSLGEYSALVAAGALAFEDAVRLVQQRGAFMSEAVPSGVGAMAAIIGLNAEKIQTLCQSVQERQKGQVCEAVNFNSDTQIVVAGHQDAVTELMNTAKENGAKRCVSLPVSVPSHCALMKPAADNLKSFIQRQAITFSAPSIPVIHNVDVKTHQTAEEIESALVKQLYQPVRWLETVQVLIQEDIGSIVECGSGKVLSGLNKRIERALQCLALESQDSFNEALTKLGN